MNARRMRRRSRRDGEYGLSSDELTRLARYNSERSRGIVHTAEHIRSMAELQRRFDDARLEQARANGWIIV